MKKFDMSILDQLFDNVSVVKSDEFGKTYVVTHRNGDAGKIEYFFNKPDELRIFVDNFPGQKKSYETNIPFQTLEEFTNKMACLGLNLISEETRTSTNSTIGSQHWFNTLMSRHLHLGNTLCGDILEKIDYSTLEIWGKDLEETSKELLRGFKYINK